MSDGCVKRPTRADWIRDTVAAGVASLRAGQYMPDERTYVNLVKSLAKMLPGECFADEEQTARIVAAYEAGWHGGGLAMRKDIARYLKLEPSVRDEIVSAVAGHPMQPVDPSWTPAHLEKRDG